MSIAASVLIFNALQAIGAYSPGDTMTDADAEQGLTQLNLLLDQWAGEQLYVYQQTPLALTVTANKVSYTIGPGVADLIAARPAAVLQGPNIATMVTTGISTTQVNCVSAVEYNMIQSVAPGTGVPDSMIYTPDYPLASIQLTPKPANPGVLTFPALTVLASFPAVTTSVTLDEGVQQALQSCLAVAVFPFFLEGSAPPAIVALSLEGKKFLRYRGLRTRAILGRDMITAGQQPAPKPPSEGSE